MSFVRARRLTSVCTVWPREGGQFPTFGEPYTLPCNFLLGGKLQRDDSGQEFMPDATFRLQFASAEDVTLKRGDVIVDGDYKDFTTPAEAGQQAANAIRKVKRGTMLVGAYDVTVYTG